MELIVLNVRIQKINCQYGQQDGNWCEGGKSLKYECIHKIYRTKTNPKDSEKYSKMILNKMKY